MASQITSLTIVYSTVYSDADQRKHQSSASLAFVRRIRLWPVKSAHSWPVTRKMFPLDDVIMKMVGSLQQCRGAHVSLLLIATTESKSLQSWWLHQIEAFPALLAICAGNSPVAGEFPLQRPVTRSFDVNFDLRQNERLCKQSWGWWFQTLLCPLWRHSNHQDFPAHTCAVKWCVATIIIDPAVTHKLTKVATEFVVDGNLHKKVYFSNICFYIYHVMHVCVISPNQGAVSIMPFLLTRINFNPSMNE